MCNVQDDGLLHMDRKSSLFSNANKCSKCGIEKGVVVLRGKEIYCRLCFLPYFVHKFRACIGKSRIMKSKDLVLISYSGGQSSSAMLHLVKEALDEDNRKKVKYIPFLLYIDEGVIRNEDLEERINNCRRVIEISTYCKFPMYITSLEMVLEDDEKSLEDIAVIVNPDDNITSKFKSNEMLKKKLGDLFDSLTSLSAKEDLLLRLRYRLISKIAEKMEVHKVFLGDIATRLSVRLLVDIAQGRGAQLTQDIGFSHGSEKQFLIVRPMREFVSKEIAIYNNLNHIESHVIPTISTKAQSNTSIQRLTEQFVEGLQTEYPSTVSTIFRTGDKIHTGKKINMDEKCILCQGFIEWNMGESSAQHANKFSHLVSSGKIDLSSLIELNPNVSESFKNSLGFSNSNSKNNLLCCTISEEEKHSCKCCNSSEQSWKDKIRIKREDLEPFLCYGCKVLVRDMKDIETLASYTYEDLQQCHRRAKMKQEIADCLLEEEP